MTRQAQTLDIRGPVGTSSSAFCWCWMDNQARRLRDHATHCRQLAKGPCTDRTRTILLTMASEFEGQAHDVEAADRLAHD